MQQEINITRQKTTPIRQKLITTLPERYINALDNKIDNELICTRGDAILTLLMRLEKLDPTIFKAPDGHDGALKNTIKYPWATEANLAEIEKVMELKSEGSVLIALDGYQTNKKLAQKFLELRQKKPEVAPPG